MEESLIHFDNVSFHYSEAIQIFDELQFTFTSDMRASLVGKNGVGKTTLLHLIMGLLKPQAGVINILGEPRRTEIDFFEVRKGIGFVFQDPNDQLFCPTVAEDIAFGPLNHGVSRETIQQKTMAVLSLLGLDGFETRVTHALSDGQRKMVSLATVLVMTPKMLILDEPTTCLDDDATDRLVKILHQLAIPYLIVSHDQPFLDRVITTEFTLANGKITVLKEQNSEN